MRVVWKKGFDQSKVTDNNYISLTQFEYAVFFEENYVGNSSQIHENRHPEKLMLNNINKFSISEDDAYDISGIVHLESIVGKIRGKTRKKKKERNEKKQMNLKFKDYQK